MPASSHWSVAQALAVWIMWAAMMAAMMLPSALPMILTFMKLGTDAAGVARARGFVAAYLLVWCGFSLAASVAQGGLQVVGWVDTP